MAHISARQRQRDVSLEQYPEARLQYPIRLSGLEIFFNNRRICLSAALFVCFTSLFCDICERHRVTYVCVCVCRYREALRVRREAENGWNTQGNPGFPPTENKK